MEARLYPGEQRKARKCKNALSFERFAETKFKVGERYAKQALAILNYSEQLFELAKDDLPGTYNTYQKRVSEDKENLRNKALLNRPENKDIKERFKNGSLDLNEAITLARNRHKDELEKAEAEKASRRVQRNRIAEIGNFLYIFGDTPAKQIAQLITPQDGEGYISDPSEQPLGKEQLLRTATILTQVANEL